MGTVRTATVKAETALMVQQQQELQLSTSAEGNACVNLPDSLNLHVHVFIACTMNGDGWGGLGENEG